MPIKRTAAGLRDALFDEMDALRENAKPDIAQVQRALAMSKLVSQVINVARAEMDFQQRLNRDEKLCDDFMLGTLKLGEPTTVNQLPGPASAAAKTATGR